MTEGYNSGDKAIRHKSGPIRDGNLASSKRFDLVRFLASGEGESFNGFSGTSEFEAFPLRQLILKRHGQYANEWDTGYLRTEDVQKFVLENKKNVMASHYAKNGKDVSKCVLVLGGKECVYVYLYRRSYEEEPDKYAVCLLFIKRGKTVESLIKFFTNLVIPEKGEQGHLNILIKTSNGYALEKKEIPCPDIDFSMNYNEDFEPIHRLIVEKLSVNNSKGLVLLYGGPGTGKTTYIRYLIHVLKKRIIYVPPNMTNSISDPELIKFFIKNPNSILIIEDAENVLIKRSANSPQAISNILNLSDGLLSDCLSIQIVATFNTNILNIDDALLRKGRLIAKYEFNQLDVNRTFRLCQKLGIKFNGKPTVADIYNANELSFNEKRRKIGFK